ncbi:maleylpyruvate isomerase N-terminal domain-containing protein [Nakamurella deserti]|uniref:maleylpyruvate isomerase N-terminal domain-containing protein n=1 Tax=Nakamurella deserti TaxID=2164074 RepID=UPI000DBE6633|nr:maleylpyruvate isomerase N-terminal domain-containing protein [Nakamurella deserti]
MPDTLRDAFLLAAGTAARLLAEPAVARHWAEPSALPAYRVSGLAGHLGLQVRYVSQLLEAPAPAGPVETLDDHYAAAAWIGAAVDDEPNVFARESGERHAQQGPATLAADVAALAGGLGAAFAAAPADRTVRLPWADRVLTLDDFLLTRMMEIVVHVDDLAVSVGVPTPASPAEVTEPVIGLLTRLAVRRHGALPLVRALSRAERAPDTVAAF